jgi:poly(A) polymerase Pap1
MSNEQQFIVSVRFSGGYDIDYLIKVPTHLLESSISIGEDLTEKDHETVVIEFADQFLHTIKKKFDGEIIAIEACFLVQLERNEED